MLYQGRALPRGRMPRGSRLALRVWHGALLGVCAWAIAGLIVEWLG
jgi:hypothetical protein